MGSAPALHVGLPAVRHTPVDRRSTARPHHRHVDRETQRRRQRFQCLDHQWRAFCDGHQQARAANRAWQALSVAVPQRQRRPAPHAPAPAYVRNHPVRRDTDRRSTQGRRHARRLPEHGGRFRRRPNRPFAACTAINRSTWITGSCCCSIAAEPPYLSGSFWRTPRYMPQRTIHGITTRSTDQDGKRKAWPVGRKTSSPLGCIPTSEPHRRVGAR